MTDSKPNQLARMVAVVALLAAFVLVGLVLLSSGDDSSDGEAGNDRTVPQRKFSKQIQRDLDRGFYVVEPGDTLIAISRKTGIDEDDLEELNPEIDPQILISGQRIKLR